MPGSSWVTRYPHGVRLGLSGKKFRHRPAGRSRSTERLSHIRGNIFPTGGGLFPISGPNPLACRVNKHLPVNETSTGRTSTGATMSKAAAAVIGMFSVGAGMMTVLGSVMGTYAEPVSLALMGVGLFAGSSMLSGGKDTAPAGVAKEA